MGQVTVATVVSTITMCWASVTRQAWLTSGKLTRSVSRIRRWPPRGSRLFVSSAYEVLSDPSMRKEYDARRASTGSCGSPVSLSRAWGIYIKFMVQACVEQFQLGADGPGRVIRLLSTLGVSAVMVTAGSSGGVALAAITAALLNSDGVLVIFAELTEQEQLEFCKAIVVISRHL